MAAGSNDDVCQKYGGDTHNPRWESQADPEHRNPSFTCLMNPQREGGPICSADEQLLPYGYTEQTDNMDFKAADFARECCEVGRFTMYYHKHNIVDDNSIKLIDAYNSKCACKGLLWLNTGMHLLLNSVDPNQLANAGENNNLPWMFPFGRKAGLRPLLHAARNASKFAVIFASTPKVSVDVFMLFPLKHDWMLFRQFDTFELWAEYDRQVTNETGIFYAPYYEASQAYKGLQCDGMHFSSRYHGDVCKGFTVLTDLIVHQGLSQVCHGIAPFINIPDKL